MCRMCAMLTAIALVAALCTTADGLCTMPSDCPRNASTLVPGATSADQCVCDLGFFANGTNCTLCPLNHHCANGTLVSCPTNSYTRAPGAAAFADCICRVAHVYVNETGRCEFCPSGSFWNVSECMPCPSDFFCPGNGVAYPCLTAAVDLACSPPGLGVQCPADHYYAPTIVRADESRAECTAISDNGEVWASKTVLYRNFTPIVGSSVAQCTLGSFVFINSIAQWRASVFFVDIGCRAVYVIDDFDVQSLRKVLSSYSVFGITLMHPGDTLLVSGTNVLIELNPVTRVEYAVGELIAGKGVASGSVHNHTAYVCDVGKIVYYREGITITVSATPTPPVLIITPQQHLVYASDAQLMQLAPDKTWHNMLAVYADFELTDRVRTLAYNNDTMQLYIGQAAALLTVSLCQPCPPNSHSTSNALGIVRCTCNTGLYLANSSSCEPCLPGYMCNISESWLCRAGYFCYNGSETMCPEHFFCPTGASAPEPCPADYECPLGASAPVFIEDNRQLMRIIFVALGSVLGAAIIAGCVTYIVITCQQPKPTLPVFTNVKFDHEKMF